VGIRFHRSFKILPGLRLNLSKKGLGVSAGPQGFKVSSGPSGVRRTMSIPGTGISKIDYLSSKTNFNLKEDNDNPPPATPPPNEPPIRQNPGIPPSNYPVDDQKKKKSFIQLMLIGLAAVIALCGSICLIGSLMPSNSTPTPDVDMIVATSVAELTLTAFPIQTLPFPTQTIAVLENIQEATVVPGIPKSQDILQTQQPQQACCKFCSNSKACGDSCIPKDKQCYEPPGCACQ
jgi:hypothetical protein